MITMYSYNTCHSNESVTLFPLQPPKRTIKETIEETSVRILYNKSFLKILYNKSLIESCEFPLLSV